MASPSTLGWVRNAIQPPVSGSITGPGATKSAAKMAPLPLDTGRTWAFPVIRETLATSSFVAPAPLEEV
ncbi:MAG: hypothetical protein QF415_00150 [Candidatus Undinarchaeales archaeon]|nr:hypothetical protein [Candidatus Undinarchaeales archaeon]MDP7492184.1 hypothetical protein [Candidatus Undinarchaeales archaeon]